MPKVPEGYLHERRRHILAAASRVFSKRGVQAATMTEVANEAGISPGLIYRYFPSKEELLACAMTESAQELEARWMEPPVDHPDPLGEFMELSAATFGALNDPVEQQHTVLHIEQLLHAVRDGDRAALIDARDNLDGIVDKIHVRLAAAKKAGQIDPSVDTVALAEVAVDFYWGTRLRKMIKPDEGIDRSWRQFTEMINSALDPAEHKLEAEKKPRKA
ncbi:MAG: TetR/AcrR family transcriptional regulator [Tepidiformaceae bacterium]